ncbi:MAG: Mitochondrial intermediate peptidase [Pleopsidium flavum]|nr:MAG: Mitochondrial intermediate peptidase [Pleopsidium flavum]
MLKSLSRQPWTCPRCLYRQQRARRSLTTAATATAHVPYDDIRIPSVDNGAPGAKHDDRTLRQIFDSQAVWRDFSHRTRSYASGRTAGLFQNHYLTSPAGFQEFARDTLRKCRKIVAKVLGASTVEEYKTMARDLDRLSDLLCRVIDVSDFVRVTHPDQRIQAAATQAYASMFEYMNVLNTTTGLNEQLQKALADPQVTALWSEEEKVVAQILFKDFAKSAIDLPSGQRQKFVDLSNDISRLGSEFVDQMQPEQSYLLLNSSKMKGMDPTTVQRLTRYGKVILPTVGAASSLALRTVEDEDTRREIYVVSRTPSTQQIYLLEQLLKRRAELAKLSGYNSFAHMTLNDKMAKTPESVNQFLLALAADNAGRMQHELAELLRLKQVDFTNGANSDRINAWDREYYRARLQSRSRSTSRKPDFLSAYFSLGTVMQGLSRLFSRLYGVRLVPHATLPGETWNDDVRRLDVIDENEGHIAVVYCDLFERPGKSPNPAHFTLRCSRQISDAEVAEAATTTPPKSTSTTPEQVASDGMSTSRNPTTNTLHQLPTIALICDFSLPSHPHRPTLLTFREVQTLFHEMGHAIHSILGRTSLQNVSGTRCATDFAELPSVLMEHFASAPEVLALFARHWETDAPLPYQMIKEKIESDRKGEAAETENQILLAMLDQHYHSSLLPLSPSFDSTRVYQDIWRTHSSVPEPVGTRWQGFFGHLYGYGATYYSYLFDRAIAGKVWKDVFQRREGGAVDREAGQVFRDEVLRWGGGRDGWRCVAGVLGDGRLSEGGAGAMAEVGRWGVRD